MQDRAPDVDQQTGRPSNYIFKELGERFDHLDLGAELSGRLTGSRRIRFCQQFIETRHLDAQNVESRRHGTRLRRGNA